MDLDNLLETIMCYLLIRWMTCFGCRDEIPTMNALVCMVTHQIRLLLLEVGSNRYFQ